MKHTTSKTSLFLMELIISILFFSLASTVCIQLFANSYTISQKTIEQNHSMVWAQNIAEIFLASENFHEQIHTIYPECLDSEESIKFYIDDHWKITSSTQYCYEITTKVSSENSLTYLTITITESVSDDIIQDLTVRKHILERAL